jgi:branched-chain amino acid transport system permease protein
MAEPESAHISLHHTLSIRAALPVLVVLLALPQITAALHADFYVTLATRIAIFALAASSLNLILGFGGMVSFGHAAFVGAGAYTAGILMQHGVVHAAIAWPAAVLVSAGLACFIGLVSLRTQGVYFIMITLAFAQMLYFLAVSLKTYGGDDGLPLSGRNTWFGFAPNDTALYYIALGALVLCLLFTHRLLNARFGQALQGLRENPVRMQALGFSGLRTQLTAFTLAGAMAGLAGALLANQGGFVSPSMMQWSQSGLLMVMVILGGVGHLYGGVLGAAAFLLLEEVLGHATEHWQLALGALLLLVVLLTPRGLASLRSLWVRQLP